MFGESKPQEHKNTEEYSRLSDTDLLERYKYLQDVTDGLIKYREKPEQQMVTVKGKELSNEEKSKKAQKHVEDNFREINALREEIEKRGLKAPTMEERGY